MCVCVCVCMYVCTCVFVCARACVRACAVFFIFTGVTAYVGIDAALNPLHKDEDRVKEFGICLLACAWRTPVLPPPTWCTHVV